MIQMVHVVIAFLLVHALSAAGVLVAASRALKKDGRSQERWPFRDDGPRTPAVDGAVGAATSTGIGTPK
jgi:hypothetical protein